MSERTYPCAAGQDADEIPHKVQSDNEGNVFTGGIRPKDPHHVRNIFTTATTVFGNIVAYTPVGKDFILTDAALSISFGQAVTPIWINIQIGAVSVWDDASYVDGAWRFNWVTGLTVPAGTLLLLRGRQDSGGPLDLAGSISGYHPDG